MASSHSEEGSDLDELLSQLEEESLQQELVTADNDGGPLHQDLEKRYEKLRAQSFTSSHVNTQLDASDNSKSCSLQTGDQGKGPASPPAGQEACDAVCADEGHLVDEESSSGIGLTHASKVAQGDAAKKASIGIPPQGGLDSANASKVALAGDAVKEASIDRPHLSPVKLPHTQHHEAHESTGRPLSPPSPPGGCSCFSLPSKRGGKTRKQKKKQVKGGGLGSNTNDLGGKREQEKIEEELEGVGQGQWDTHAGIFDVKGTEMEFKRVSKKEKQLTQEAQKFLEKVASTSARLTSPPH